MSDRTLPNPNEIKDSSKYFHRTFLEKPNEDIIGTAITARVNQHDPDFPYLSANLVLRKDEEYDGSSFHMYFSGGEDPKEIDAVVRRAKVLYEIVEKFYNALEEEASAVKKSIASKKGK